MVEHRNSDRSVKAYAEEHREAFARWNAREAKGLVSGPLAFAGIVILTQSSLMTYFRVGDVKAFFPFLLSFLILGSAPLLTRIPSMRASFILEVLALSLIGGACYQIKIMADIGQPPSGLPILLALLAAFSLTFHSKAGAIIVRALLYTLLIPLLVSFSSHTNISALVNQIGAGSFVGSCIALSNLRSRFYRFYAEKEMAHTMMRSYAELRRFLPRRVVDMIEAGHSLDEAMPVGISMACVLSFDIVRTANIKHPEYSEAVNQAKIRCFEVLNEGYDFKLGAANGYRIQDLGDGFVCSIGFPYQAPPGRSATETAHDLALRFSDIFDQEMAKLHLPEHPDCAMGIAYGEIQGSFSAVPPICYELHGKAIIMASRYRSVSQHLLRTSSAVLSGNTTLISESVWLGLPEKDRLQYKLWNPNENVRIRDDSPDMSFYYMVSRGSKAIDNDLRTRAKLA